MITLKKRIVVNNSMSYALGGILLGPYYKGRSSIQAKSTVNDAIRYTWVVGKSAKY
jgi:hypothetical protein